MNFPQQKAGLPRDESLLEKRSPKVLPSGSSARKGGDPKFYLREAAQLCNAELARKEIEINHRTASHESAGSMADSMSPVIFTMPSSRPKNSRGASSARTSLATGRPPLVVNTASLVF